MKINLIIATFFLLSFSNISSAEQTQIPDELKNWSSWVLKDSPAINCPTTYDQNKTICAYPGALNLNINYDSGTFSQTWQVFTESVVFLPGNNQNWPKGVIVNGEKYPVVSQRGKPSILLPKGDITVSGTFSDLSHAKTLAIPQTTGIVNLTINDKKVIRPDIRKSQLWLKSNKIKKHKNNALDIEVYRKLSDSIPMLMTTHIKLAVSGQAREIHLEGALLEGFILSGINSRLPAQMDASGKLKLQIKPGQWSLDIHSKSITELTKLTLPTIASPWPDNEVWVLEHQPQLRLIKVVDKQSIDPTQTQLPQSWKSLPTYLMKAQARLNFDVLKRGDPQPEPDQLSLTKKIWLDFDGGGYTVNDKIKGTLSRQWRLNSDNDISLGQVSLSGKPQLITENNAKQGIEVRHGNVDLTADSRMDNLNQLPASGWDTDFTGVKGTLYLPAGWKLLASSGVNASSAWIDLFTLLDLFMILITTIATYKLWGVKWGAVALATLILVWHESFSPQYVWINLIVAVALLRGLTSDGRFYKLVHSYRLMTSLVLVVIALPFIVNQARTAIYPQLEFSNMKASYSTQGYVRDDLRQQKLKKNRTPKVSEAALEEREMKMEMDYSSYASRPKPKKIARIDPDATIQTGPGLPAWTLHDYRLRWDGPVSASQKISFTLLSPTMNRLLSLLKIALVLLLAWRLLDITSLKLPKPSTKTLANPLALILSVVMLSGLNPSVLEAAYPPQKLLEELAAELKKPADCLPQCASIESMAIDIQSDTLNIKLVAHAQEPVFIPLPIPAQHWVPSRIEVDGETVSGLFKKDDATLLLYLKEGVHRIDLLGQVAHLNDLPFSFPLKPHHISAIADGWDVQGLSPQSYKISGLTFSRVGDEAKKVKENALPTPIPVHSQIKRTLSLGLDWFVTTEVQATSGTDFPIILSIPLLAGESVITDNIKVDNNKVIITLNKNQRSVQWISKLPQEDHLKLTSTSLDRTIEKWQLDASPIWHVEHEGIPVIYHQRQGSKWQPQWEPWPGESVTISISKPEGIKGSTLTIDSSTLTLTPGEQITNAVLKFNLRSSLGGQHNIRLPENTDLQSVRINNKSIPVRKTAGGLALPISPGSQQIEIKWRESRGITSLYKNTVVDLGIESVNHEIIINPGNNRWTLFVSGPAMGPAILFWGMLLVIIIVAIGLGRIGDTPLTTLHWILLGIGLSSTEPLGVIFIVATILAFRARATLDLTTFSNFKFNGFQLLLILLVFISVSSLITGIQQGLLGSPQMQITGNGSTAYQLNWFSDRIANQTSQAMLISVPVYIYRLMMLAWSIWLAFALIKWAQWGWSCFTKDEYWRKMSLVFKHKNSKEKEQVIKDKKSSK